MAFVNGVVLRKEVVDNLRDRRSLAAALLYPFLGPVMILLLVFAIGKVSEEAGGSLELPVQGREHAPNLLRFLEQNDVVVLEPPANPEAAVREGDEDVVLLIPEGFGEAFRSGEPASVQLVADESRTAALASIRRAEAILDAYSTQIGRLRLQARGVDPRISRALDIDILDLSTPQSQAARILNMAPYLIIVSLFVGGMYLAIDSTAGERERGSLEPLLINPIGRTELVFGKGAAILLFTAVAALETLVGFAIIFHFVPIEEYLGVRLSLEPLALGWIFLISVPIMLFAVALQMTIASYTKSFKEAQNYISVMLLIPALPAIFLAILPVRHEVWLMALPTVGQQVLINQIFRGEVLSLVNVAISSGVTLLAALALFIFVVRRYRRESILFG